MGKKRSESYLDWNNPKTIHWVMLQRKKHPEITHGQIPSKEIMDGLVSGKIDGRTIILLPGQPNPPPDGSDWTHFLPGDWDAWLFYYEEAKRAGFNMTINYIVRFLAPYALTSGIDEYTKVYDKIKNEFKKARDRINQMIDLPEDAIFPSCPPGTKCSECPEYQKCGKVKR